MSVRLLTLRGQVPYRETREFQLKLVDLRAKDEIPDTVLFLEHAPVITRGKGLQLTGEDRPRHMPLPSSFPDGVDFCETDRGGDLTYHGPGQLVIYPIFKLDGSGPTPKEDLHAYLRWLESLIVDELGAYQIQARARPKATGVWVGEQKVASVGIAVRNWVTFHGLAVNVVNDLKPFQSISPCGFGPEVMTRVSDLIPDFEKFLESFKVDWRTFFEVKLAWRITGRKDILPRQIDLARVFKEGIGKFGTDCYTPQL